MSANHLNLLDLCLFLVASECNAACRTMLEWSGHGYKRKSGEQVSVGDNDGREHS